MKTGPITDIRPNLRELNTSWMATDWRLKELKSKMHAEHAKLVQWNCALPVTNIGPVPQARLLFSQTGAHVLSGVLADLLMSVAGRL
ncbi:hypothetical protein TGCAST_313055 [Toxoplasma gondii CAST]|uniref:Uncharacterized protein n=1 Tax=Toxoplasma gondii CAST TaxID=943122 RepID=A0A425I1U9_TOXGO|nr:hypothetical protein TGCAST_313055 [Toxoplasma gondii CAST]